VDCSVDLIGYGVDHSAWLSVLPTKFPGIFRFDGILCASLVVYRTLSFAFCRLIKKGTVISRYRVWARSILPVLTTEHD
jgi:hypothetical protein